MIKVIDKAIGQFCMMMERDFADEMNIQEDLATQQTDQEGWIRRIKGAMAGDEKVEPFQFKPQVCPLTVYLLINSPSSDLTISNTPLRNSMLSKTILMSKV
jgi:hypothetical protein